MTARQPRRRDAGATLARILAALLLAGCAVTAEPTPTPATPATAAPPATVLPVPSAAPQTTATPTPAPVAGPIGGTWRVRKILSPDHRSELISGTVYDEEAFVVRPTCPAEPCPEIEVRMTPLGRASPVTVATLRRDGDTYVTEAQAQSDGPCRSALGDPIPGGAAITQTLRLWLTRVRPAGTAVESTLLQGAIELELTPTEIGAAGGCQPQVAAYDLSGRREAVAVATARPSPRPTASGSTTAGGGLADLPRLGVKVTGATIDYFAIEGSTAGDLLDSLARGGVRACGEINYEWHEGDQRPAACTVTRFPDFDEALSQRTSASGACRITDSDVRARFTIHFPRWTAPDRVPKRLLAWWRDVVDFIRDHEAQHVAISREAVDALNEDLDGADCDEASDVIQRWARDLTRAQEAFDRAEYARPWPEPPPGA